MSRLFTRLLIPLFVLFSLSRAWSQGCSDAGFCTMGAMKPDQPYSKKIALKLRSMEVNFYRGTTTLTPIVYVATADLNFSLNSKTTFQVKLPYQAVKGRLATTQGLGDISLCLTRNVFTSEKYDINFSVGGKLPTNHSDKRDEEGNPLPMYYQTSLGTYDFITGISLISRKWLFATGIQIPLNRNGNQFLWSRWNPDSSPEELAYIHEYSPSNDLRRGTDVMLRVERSFRFSRLNFTVGMLPIYRIYHDQFTDATGQHIRPDGGMGLALSATLTAGYSFNVRSGIKLLVAHKIVNREYRGDGLTRELVTTFGYYYRF